MKGWTQEAVDTAKTPKARANASNTGKVAESLLESLVLAPYAQRGIAKIEKVDPPVRIYGGRTIFMANPYLDYTGCWTEKGAVSLHIELKSKKGRRLPFGNKNGITGQQCATIEAWHKAGGVAFVVWMNEKQLRIFTWPQIWEATLRGDKSFKWEDGHIAEAGRGTIADILKKYEEVT